MSYRQPTAATGVGVFFGYRSTAVTITTGNTKLPMTDASNGNTIASGSLDFGSVRRFFACGEIRADNAADYQLGDIKIVTNDGETAEGYQVRNNAAGTVVMDDGCYGVSNQSTVSLFTGQLQGSATSRAEANELRVTGVFTS
jgi:hypothetical protein